MPIHHSKQFFSNLACPLSELRSHWGFVPFLFFFFFFFFEVAANVMLLLSLHSWPVCKTTCVRRAHNTADSEPEQDHDPQKLMRMQESLMIAFSLILGRLVHPFWVFA